MSKRQSDNNFDFIVKKIRKLEQEIKRDRQIRRSFLSSSSSSSSSSASSSPEILREMENGPNEDDSHPVPPGDNSTTLMKNLCPETSNGGLQPTEANPIMEDRSKDEYLDILGEDPSTTAASGPDIHKEVASRFGYIVTSGLDKESRKSLMEKYQIPQNCTLIAAPHLNAEIKAALSDSVAKRDKAIEFRQNQLAAGIASLGTIISNQLTDKNDNHQLVKDLMDLGRLLCDFQHSQSLARRSLALNYVKKDLKDHLSLTKINTYLFGDNLTEILKSAKAVSRSSSDLRAEQQKKFKSTSNNPKTNLNWKTRSSARRQPTGQAPRQQQPATASAPVPRYTPQQPYARQFKHSRRQ